MDVGLCQTLSVQVSFAAWSYPDMSRQHGTESLDSGACLDNKVTPFFLLFFDKIAKLR